MAKRKNYTPEQLHNIRVEAGRKSWEIKQQKMAENPDYARRIQLGWQKGLYRAKVKRQNSESFYEFKKREQEWQESHTYTPEPPAYYTEWEDTGDEESVLDNFLNESIEGVRADAQAYLRQLYQDELENYRDMYGDEGEERFKADIAERLDENGELVAEAVGTVESDSNDSQMLKDAMYDLAEIITGNVTVNMLYDISDIADTIIPPYYKKRKNV